MPLNTEQITAAFDLNNLAREHYGLELANIKMLPGEVDLNVYIETSSGEAFILKIARQGEDPQYLDLQNKAMLHLAQNQLPLQLPKVVPNKEGHYTSLIKDAGGHERLMRILTWVPGRLFAKINPHSPHLLKSLGKTC